MPDRWLVSGISGNDLMVMIVMAGFVTECMAKSFALVITKEHKHENGTMSP